MSPLPHIRTLFRVRTMRGSPWAIALVILFACMHAAHAGVLDTPAASPAGFGLPLADNVIVRKGERRLYLMREGEVLKSYPVALGLRPTGHKEQEGDFRTPEGKYRLIRRNARSDYFLSIEVSYPNASDVARAKELGVSPGGAIMIHGLPNNPRRTLDYYRTTDWTDGCIAVSSSDMVEIWMMTPLNTPIEITP